MNPGLLCTSSLFQLKLKPKLLYLIPPIFIRESKFELSTFCLEIPKSKILLAPFYHPHYCIQETH